MELPNLEYRVLFNILGCNGIDKITLRTAEEIDQQIQEFSGKRVPEIKDVTSNLCVTTEKKNTPHKKIRNFSETNYDYIRQCGCSDHLRMPRRSTKKFLEPIKGSHEIKYVNCVSLVSFELS